MKVTADSGMDYELNVVDVGKVGSGTMVVYGTSRLVANLVRVGRRWTVYVAGTRLEAATVQEAVNVADRRLG